MGVVSRQAIYNSFYSVMGVAVGAINTIFILPRAFEENPDDLGLLRLLLAYATIIGSVFGLGLYNLIIRENTAQKSEDYKKNVLAYALLLSTIGLATLAIIINGFPQIITKVINAKEAYRLIPQINNLIILSFVIIFSQYFNSFIITQHKSPFVQFIKDPFLKLSYFILSVTYLYHPFSFALFLKLFVGIYAFSVLLLFLYSLSIGYSIQFKLHTLRIKEFLVYGLYTILDKSATLIINNLDLVMIGYILNLDKVGYYSIAFFIGAVIIIPQKAIMTPSYPLVSNFLSKNNLQELGTLYKQSSINQLLAGGVIFVLIWINIDALFSLMPDNFAPGKWVVFYIGISKLFMLSTGVSGPIIILSKHYRINILFNITLIALTIFFNYILIHRYGITGAAMGTAITFGIYNWIKFVYVKRTFGIQPFTPSSFKTIAILLVTLVFFHFVPMNWGWHPFISIPVKSLVAGSILLLLLDVFKVQAAILRSFWSIIQSVRNP